MSQDLKELSRRKLNFFQTLKAISWAMFGIRKGSGSREDMAKLNPVHVVLAADYVNNLGFSPVAAHWRGGRLFIYAGGQAQRGRGVVRRLMHRIEHCGSLKSNGEQDALCAAA